MERIAVLEIFLKNQWYKAQVGLEELGLSVTLLDSTLDHLPQVQFDSITDQVRTVRVVKNGDTNFGISIKGGKENDMPVFISKIFKETPADLTGQLHVGDSILSVNGQSLRDATHEDAVKALKQAGKVADLEVKYLREVMLQYKKASLLPEIGWNFAAKHLLNGESNANDSSSESGDFCLPQIGAASMNVSHQSKSDTKVIPLLLCHLTSRIQSQRQYLGCVQASFERATFDSEQLELIGRDEGRVLLLYSPDLRSSCAIRFADAGQCFVWSNAIQSVIHTANSNAVSEANLVLRDVLDSVTIKHMGWLNERMDDGQMRCTFLVLTNRELLFYDFVPWTAHSWAFPVHSYPLIHSRLVCSSTPSKFNGIRISPVHSESNSLMSASENGSGGLIIRFGTTLGVVVVQMFSESQKTLLQWANLIIHNANNAALAMGETTFECIFDGHECILTLDVEFGFVFTDKKTQKVLYMNEFAQLRNSSDDNARFVTLHFADEKSTIEIDMLVNPKPFIFTLHTFLFAKMSKLGLLE